MQREGTLRKFRMVRGTPMDFFSLFNYHLMTMNDNSANGEHDANRTIRKSRIVAQEGKRTVARLVEHCNLEAIFYRMRSLGAEKVLQVNMF